MKASSIHPLFVVMAVLAIGTSVYALYQKNPLFAPALLVFSLVGLALRAWSLSADQAPEGSIRFEELRAKDLTPYRGWLKENVRGHDRVIDAVARRLEQGLKLCAPGRTLGAFMLVGPTGTGKTFLAELVAKALYPDAEPVTLRMNQYKLADDVLTLLGPPPGHVGYEVGGALTRPVLQDPHRVIVLDEIDKCHPDVRDCLYNVLDTGECREKSSGKLVSFSACAIFATCNVGVDALRDARSGTASLRDAFAAATAFDKAFVARFDEILLMDELPLVNVAEVACLQLAKFWRGYGIEVSYAHPELIVEAVAKNAELREYGVRQLARLVQGLTETAIEQAKRDGARKVRLESDDSTGGIKVIVLEGA